MDCYPILNLDMVTTKLKSVSSHQLEGYTCDSDKFLWGQLGLNMVFAPSLNPSSFPNIWMRLDFSFNCPAALTFSLILDHVLLLLSLTSGLCIYKLCLMIWYIIWNCLYCQPDNSQTILRAKLYKPCRTHIMSSHGKDLPLLKPTPWWVPSVIWWSPKSIFLTRIVIALALSHMTFTESEF